jgi:hypothetical protein
MRFLHFNAIHLELCVLKTITVKTAWSHELPHACLP